MNQFDDLLNAKALATGVSVTSKKQLFQKLSEMAASAYGLDAGEVFERLTERERLGSTGFGGGIAIPHAKLDRLDRLCGMVVLLDPPLSFDAIDEAPVDVVFALLSPLDSGAEHLKTLARVSRYLRNDAQIARVRGVGSTEALFALLSGAEARDAA
ncbi:MAG: PTS lactose transporter subunit IIC [Sphingobium sp.]|jgi:PTS system nitrogen regulatory IIA component|nr:MAG: PTS lactose transporter subunit IIC [Sphingobium sp.]